MEASGAAGATMEEQLAALKTLSESGILDPRALSRSQSAVLSDWHSRVGGKEAARQRVTEQRLAMRAEAGKRELESKLQELHEQQRALSELCEANAAEMAAVRLAEIQAKGAVASGVAEIRRALMESEHRALLAVATAESAERETIARQRHAAESHRDALGAAVEQGKAALALPDGVDFIAGATAAIALLDAELAAPPGEAHAAVESAAAHSPIVKMLSGSVREEDGDHVCDAQALSESASAMEERIRLLDFASVETVGLAPPPVEPFFERTPTRSPDRSAESPPRAWGDDVSALALELQDGLTPIKRDAEAGDAAAMYRLGCCLQHGLGTDVDLEESRRWMRDAAEREHPSAQFALGYETEGGERVQWFRRAAEHGHPQAQCALGCCLLSGEAEGDSAQHEREARTLFESAAKADPPLPEAQCNLAACCAQGLGGAVDVDRARQLYTAAAQQGDATAQCALGGAQQPPLPSLLRILHRHTSPRRSSWCLGVQRG